MKELEEYLAEAVSGKRKHNIEHSGLEFLTYTSYNDMMKLMEEEKGNKNIYLRDHSQVDDLFNWISTKKWYYVSEYFLDGNTYTCTTGDSRERYAIMVCKEYIFVLYYTGSGKYKKMKVIETKNFQTITNYTYSLDIDLSRNTDDRGHLDYLANIFIDNLLR